MFYFDEELQEWVDDESGEIEVPLPPKEELKYRNEPPSPPSLGLGGRYAMGKLPNDYVPEERPSGLSMPSMLNPKDYGDPLAGSGPYDPETSAMITGYGKNLMLRKAGNPNEQPWMTPGGAIAPPDYVQDIESTMGKLDRGEMSETQLGEKIKANEYGGVLPKPPQEAELRTTMDVINFRKAMLPEIQKQAVEAANADWESMSQGRDLSWKALHKDNEIAKRVTYHLNEGLKDLNRHLDKKFNSLLAQEQAAMQPKTTTDLVKGALREELGREPTAKEILERTAQYNAESAGAKEKSKTEAKGTFKDWTPEAKEQEFTLHMITGKPPVSAAGLGGGDRQQYGKEYAQWKADKGIKPSDVALMQADYKAGDMSLKNMTKQEAPMDAFVGNINKQIEKVKTLYDNNDRIGLRLVDLPIRELKMRALGSGDEAVKASYLMEISREIGKLSTGSQASIAELSVEAQKKWDKIHDPSLSIKELMKVLEATQEQGNMRLSTWKEAKERVRGQIKALGELEGGVKPKTDPQIPSKPRLTPQQALEILNRRRGKQ